MTNPTESDVFVAVDSGHNTLFAVADFLGVDDHTTFKLIEQMVAAKRLERYRNGGTDRYRRVA